VTRTAVSALLAILCAALLAACGDAEDPPDGAAASTLSQTVAATSKLDNARLAVSFRLEPDGPLALGGPIVVRASGPFAAPAGAGELARFDLKVSGALGSLPLRAGAISTGRRAYLRIADRAYRVDDELVDALRSESLGAGRRFAPLGLNPATWIANPRAQGAATLDGVATERIVGEIDMKAVLADIARLLKGAGADEFLTVRTRDQIADAVKSSRVELWTGIDDRILRQIAIAVDFTLEDKKAGRSIGLEGGKIDLRLRLSDVNTTRADVKAPKGARPLSELATAGGLDALLGGLKGSAGLGDGGEAVLKCLESAGGDSSAVARCASKLAVP
jgi:hypothetical protein